MKKAIIFLIVLFSQIIKIYAQDLASNLSISWELKENNYKGKSQFLASFIINNKGEKSVDLQQAKLYFSYPRTVVSVTTNNAKFENLSGEFCRISFGDTFKALAPKASITITYLANGKSMNYTDAPSGLYLVFNQNLSKTYPIKNFKINAIPAQEKTSLKLSPEKVFDKNKVIADIPLSQLQPIIPAPNVYQAKTGFFKLNGLVSLNFDADFEKEATFFNQEINQLLGKSLIINNQNSEAQIFFKKVAGLAEEAYQIKVEPQQIILSATNSKGIFYAIQSLKMMFPVNSWAKKQNEILIPCADVADAPRFAYRSFMLDVARNFQTKQQVLKILDLLALYKINTLHFHLNDDEGWRLEIPGLPELTEVSAKRGHTLDDKENLHPSYGSGGEVDQFPGSGFYTKADFIEILKYAKARHIQVIPEIETPGHARAAIKAMDARYNRLKSAGNLVEAQRYLLRDTLDQSIYKSVQGYRDNVMNIALPSTYNFIEKVIDEVAEMYKTAKAPIKTIHLGGDEVPAGVWQKSPAIQSFMLKENIKNDDDLWYYYLAKANEIIKSKGFYLSGWEEVAMRKTKLDGKPIYIANPDFTTQNFHAYVWNNVWGWGQEDLAYRLANAGYKVVLAPVTNFYFDLACQKDADEPGLYWGSFVDVDKPFDYNPLDHYKTAKEDVQGNPLDTSIFKGKERLTDFGASNIVGLQSQIWSEKIRGPQELEYMLLPKLLGFAQRAWSKTPEWVLTENKVEADTAYQKDWNWFVNILGKRELPRLNHYAGGFNYRIPTAGAKIIEGKVVANIQFPDLTIRYTTNSDEPNLKSKIYTSPIAAKGTIKFKVFNAAGRAGRTVEIINP